MKIHRPALFQEQQKLCGQENNCLYSNFIRLPADKKSVYVDFNGAPPDYFHFAGNEAYNS